MNGNKLIGVFIEKDNNLIDKYKNCMNNFFQMSIFTNTSSALPYIVENNINILFCVIRWNTEPEESVKLFMEKIHSINPLIKIIVIETVETFSDYYSEIIKKYNIMYFTKNEEVKLICQKISDSIDQNNIPRRKYSRVNWPLNVIISFFDKSKPKIERNILSISGNGAYICSDTNIPQKGETLGLTISFKDFKLFTEARVVWTNEDNKREEYPNGFGVSFVDIGVASQKIIDSIIRDKLLQEILVEHEDEKSR